MKGRQTGTKVDIASQCLCDVLRDIFKDCDSLSLNRGPPTAEPSIFYHAASALRARLEEEASLSPDQVLKADLMAALRFVDEDYSQCVKEVKSLLSCREITWDFLWALFSPNIMIYNDDEITEQPQVFIFRGIEVEYTRAGTRYWSIRADFIADSRQKFGFASHRKGFVIHEYEGARKIRDLVTYPLQFYENEAVLRKELVERGKKYSRLNSPTI
jgi:hypothetical protein